jgi:hypothetical protein
MKITKLLCAIVLVFVGGSILAESFMIVNPLNESIACKVKAGSLDKFIPSIDAKKSSALINIYTFPLDYVAWLHTNGQDAYVVNFDGNVSLQPNKKNFFNITNTTGGFMHNFSGKKVTGQATKIGYVEFANK